MIHSQEIPDLSGLETENGDTHPLTQTMANVLRHIEKDGLDIDRIMDAVVETAVRHFDAYDGSLIVINEAQHIEHTGYYQDEPHRRQPDVFLQDVLREGVAGWVIRKRRPYLLSNIYTDKQWLKRPDTPPNAPPESAISAPLLTRGRVIGVLTLHRQNTPPLNNQDLVLLANLASEAASHVENARLFAASQRQLQIAALLNEASRAINSSLDLTEIMKSLLLQMNDFLNAEAVSIALVDEQTKELVYQVATGVGENKIAGLRVPSNQGVSGWVLEHCQPVLVPDTSRDPRFQPSLGDKRTGYPTRAMICAPIQYKGEVLGTIQAINPSEGSFMEQDLDLLMSLANIASTAIANATQFARTQAAEAQYATLFQDTINPIILTDLEGHIIQVNRRATQILRCKREDLLGKPINQLHEPGADLLKASAVQSDSVKVFTSKIQTWDGQSLSMEVYARRTLFEQSEILQWIFHDISKHVELEEMRRDLTAMLFHDLQSPLGNVISSLELLSYEIPPMDPSSPLLYMLDIAKRSSERLQTLVRSLLDINRLEAGHPIMERTLVDIYDLVDEVREIERPNFEQRRVLFVEDLAPALPDIYVEEDMIRRVLVNLVGNALKYSMEGQQITVAVELTEEQNGVVFSVSDQGMGIPVEFRQSIFEKFERIKHSSSDSKGLGLGLAFCRLAVEAHNGRIWVDDASSGGACFRFTIPFKVPTAPLSRGG
ncbi:MAG: GAF domain-containing protein [Anaerolineae bacterium]|nr:GAF domain-containing protein [Anaerolineae bacterium]